jgi:hypothetical protein
VNLDLTDEETAALLRELDVLIDGDRYFLSPRIKTLKAIRAKIRPEPVRPHYPRRRSAMSHRGRLQGRDGERGGEQSEDRYAVQTQHFWCINRK